MAVNYYKFYYKITKVQKPGNRSNIQLNINNGGQIY